MKVSRAIYCIPNVGMCYIDYAVDVVVGLRLSPNWDSVSGCERSPFSDALFEQIKEYFAGGRGAFDVKFEIGGLTPFQQSVLRAVQQIPYGERRSYKQIAEMVDNPAAVRAVGAACGRNPIHILIPCHRVVGSRGALTGYAAGVEIKRQMLELEGGR